MKLKPSTALLAKTTLLATLVLTTNSYALKFGPPITMSVNTNSQARLTAGEPEKQEVTLMNIQLTNQQLKNLYNYHPKKIHTFAAQEARLPHAVNLHMNEVPVLNQGKHGTCVTFATTAAVDAVIGHGDYVSQLCQLELGNYLDTDSYDPDGWDGSTGPLVLEQMMRFGIINNANQQKHTCAQVSKYPSDKGSDHGNPMSLDEYKSMSEDLSDTLYSIYHLNAVDRFISGFSNDAQMDAVLLNVKQALAKGHRLTFGVILSLTPYCSASACASFHQANDTWALTKQLSKPPFSIGGHEMVITGYDDDAVAIDADGNRHQGLLFIRNSWGTKVGDNGDFYMTYDYFRKFADEVQEIVPLPQDDATS